MEEIFIAIMERIAEKMPELSYIDEDYGQLEAGAEEDHYPVTFPCVLVGNAESDWNDLGYGVQKSESLITIRLAIDCYDDTHYTSKVYSPIKSESWTAVRRGFFTFGTGFTSRSFSSRHLRRIMDMIRSSEMKNSCRDNTFRASSKRRRCTSVQ